MDILPPDNHSSELLATTIRNTAKVGQAIPSLGEDLFSATPVQKQSFEAFSTTRPEEAYEVLSDKTRIAKFENFLSGTDNNERFAQNQTKSEQWVNGVEKALLKTGNAVLGGTVGIVYGLGAMAAEGSLTALYDNDFSNTLSDWDTKLNYQLPNYYTKQESEKGLFGQIGTTNFWADKVLGGLSFTAGAIISEGIWAAATGGTSLATSAARWGAKLGRGTADVARWSVEGLGEAGALSALAKNKSFLKQSIETAFDAGKINKALATNLGVATDILNTARFAATSAGFESSIEALQFKKESTEKFYNNFFKENGREPDSEDISTFNENLRNSSNAVFGVNMAIVGSSNLVTMGKLFELKNPINTGLTDFIEAKAFGYGVEKTGAGTYRVLQATRGQKIARNVFAYSKAPITEGLYEEGLQGTTNKAANKWLDHTYSDKNTAQTFSMMGAVYESLSDQYGTKEGWVENGVGMIIGALGGTTNTRAQLKAKQGELEFKAKGLETFAPESTTLQQALLPKKIMMANQIAGFSAEAKAEAGQGNVGKSHIAGVGVIHAFLNHKYALGESFEEAAKDVRTSLNTITVEQFKNAGVEEKDIDKYKEETLNNFIDLSKSFKKNRKFSEYIIGRTPTVGENNIKSILGDSFKGLNTNQALIESMTWVLTEGETAQGFMNDIQAKISQEVGVEYSTTLNTISRLNKLSGYKAAEISDATRRYEFLTLQRDILQKEIAKLNAKPKETEGDQVRGKQLESKNLELIDINESLVELDSTLEGYAEELTKQESYQQDVASLDFSQDIGSSTITARDLLNLNKNVSKFQSLADNLKTTNPQRGAYINDLLDEYAQAEDIFLTNQRTVDMLISGEMKLEKINTWLGKKTSKNKSMDEATRDWLTDALNKYETNVLSVIGEVTSEEIAPQTEEELIARKEELESLSEEDRTEETDIELSEIEAKLNPVNKNRVITPFIEEIIPTTPVEIYKNRIEKMLKKGYYSLENIGKNYEDLKELRPTEAEIEEFRNLSEEDARYEELGKKLSDYKLLASATDEDGNSIVDLINIIEQLERPQAEQDIKTELTPEDLDLAIDDLAASSDLNVPELLQNVKGSVTVKRPSGTNVYRFSHLKLNGIVRRLGAEPTVDGKVISEREIDRLLPGSVMTVLGIDFKLGEGGTIEINIDKFNSVKQALNMEIIDSGTNWSYKNLFEFNGVQWVKVESEFEEDFDQNDIYDLEEGSDLHFEIGNEDGYNVGLYNNWINAQTKLENSEATDKTKLEDGVKEALRKFKSGIKIYAVDFKGRRVSVVKATKSGVVEESFLRLRQRAFDNFNTDLEVIDLKTTTKVTNIYLGSPELIIFDGVVQNVPFTEAAITQVLATGFMEDESVTTSREFPKGVDTTFIAKIAKQNKGIKIPFIVIKKGAYNLAYPVNLVKTPNSKTTELDGILNSSKTVQQAVVEINNLIQQYKLNVKPLTYSDVNNQAKMDEVTIAFENYETHISAEDFADKSYKKENLITDANINIDLENIDDSISDAKIKISLDADVIQFEEDIKVLKAQELTLVTQMSNLVDKLYDTVNTPRGVEIKDRPKNQFIEMIINGTESNLPTKSTAGESQDSDIFRRVNKNLLLEAAEYVGDLDKDGKELVRSANIQEVRRLKVVYNRLLKDIEISKKTKNSGIANVKC